MFRPVKIKQYAAFMESRGFDQEALFAGTGVDASQLSAPAYLIDFPQYRAVVANMIQLTANQGIGLEVGAESQLTDFGVVGHAMMSSRTARDALELWIRYSNSLVGLLMTLRLDEPPGGPWSLRVEETRPMGFLYNFGVEELLMIALRMGSALTGKQVLPAMVELTYPEPKHHARYAELLRCTLRFNSSQTRMTFEGISLTQSVTSYDEEFNAICVQYCGRILRQVERDSPLIARIRGLLLRKGQEFPSLDQLASDLAMSARSLRRHLQLEGYTYQRLINEFRLDLSKEYLGVSRMTAKQTCYLLGFRDITAFRRAFKAWTGKTVHEFQEESGAGS